VSDRNATRRVGDTREVLTDKGADARLIRIHCDYIRRTGATARTIEQRRENLARFGRAVAPTPLLDVTPGQLDEWQAGLRVSLSSVATYSSHIRAFYGWAVLAGHLEHDPCVRLPRPRVPKRSARPIPEHDLRVALACAPEPVLTWLVLGAFMGLRAAEIAGLRREDVVEVDRRLIIGGTGKGQKPFRLPVPAEVEPYLRSHLRGGGGPLWRTARGRPAGPHYVTDQVANYFRGLGMPYTLHWCRHHFGSLLYRQSRDLLLVQECMRHSSPNTTRLYVETVDADAVAAMDRLSAQLASKRAERRTATHRRLAVVRPDDHPPPARRRGAA
jgi:integrase/recombinase XerC